MGNQPNTSRRFVVYLNGQIEGEGVRFSTGAAVYYDLPTGYIEPHEDMTELRAETSGVIVYLDPDPACPYCYGSGVSDNYHCHCYGPAADQTPGNLAIRLRVEAEHGM